MFGLKTPTTIPSFTPSTKSTSDIDCSETFQAYLAASYTFNPCLILFEIRTHIILCWSESVSKASPRDLVSLFSAFLLLSKAMYLPVSRTVTASMAINTKRTFKLISAIYSVAGLPMNRIVNMLKSRNTKPCIFWRTIKR